MKSEEVIRPFDLYKSVSLISRQMAKDIYLLALRMNQREVMVDFENIQFAGRSFFNEMYNAQMVLHDKNISLRFINLSPPLFSLYEMVKQLRDNKSPKESDLPADTEHLTI